MLQRWPRLAVACVIALAAGVFLASLAQQDDTDDGGDPAEDELPEGHPALDGSDQFEELSLAELETEVADESAPVSLRLTLAERYLQTGDLQKGHDQARLALAQAAPVEERQRALRDLGWAKALLDRPERGAELLEESLELTPGEPNATWYLANVRLVGLDDPEGAIALLEELLAGDLDTRQQALVENLLDDARGQTSRD